MNLARWKDWIVGVILHNQAWWVSDSVYKQLEDFHGQEGKAVRVQYHAVLTPSTQTHIR